MIIQLVSLNIWGGKINQPLLDFIEKNKETDVFCFQEVSDHAPLMLRFS